MLGSTLLTCAVKKPRIYTGGNNWGRSLPLTDRVDPTPCGIPANYEPLGLAFREGAIQSDALTLRTFAIRLVSITAASLRFPSELATVMTVDAKRHANFRGRLKNCQ